MNFKEIFIDQALGQPIAVPDYQRAYSWEKKQIDLFIHDLKSHQERGGYYFGHFILEQSSCGWEVVDGQQRLTTVVLFLAVCQKLFPAENHPLACLLERFKTVNYDQTALDRLLDKCLPLPSAKASKLASDEEIIRALNLKGSEFTLSQRRMVHAAKRMRDAFESAELVKESVPAYLRVIAESLCSLHVTYDKAVAVSVFEMHNTRGVALKLIEIIKAKLMRFVYQMGGPDKNALVSTIQAEFAAIHAMEEKLELSSFRGEMSIDAIVRHHLRVIDDGRQTHPEDFDQPDHNAGSDKLLAYIDRKLAGQADDLTAYPLALAAELRKSVEIVCKVIPKWDEHEDLVGDVMILNRGLSCEFFLIICRSRSESANATPEPLSSASLRLWEKLLFTHDFHGRYYNLKTRRDDFPTLFSRLEPNEKSIAEVINHYLVKGFRDDRTGGDLQKVVLEDFGKWKDQFLTSIFGWRRDKVVYALYKYEVAQHADIRRIMKDTISVEHILPQNWDLDWIEKEDSPPREFSVEADRQAYRQHVQSKVASFINGLGNLLLVTRQENSALSNEHPARKDYLKICQGGSYLEHEEKRDLWKSSAQWETLIAERGKRIYDFILTKMLE
jgi:hypothetical protein